MKKILATAAFLCFASIANAQIPVIGGPAGLPNEANMKQMLNQAEDLKKEALSNADPMKFCYFSGVAFSEGAVHEGKTCARFGSPSPDDKLGQRLVWKSSKVVF